MTFRYAALVAAGLAVAFSSSIANATGYHPVAAVAAPVTRALGVPVGGSAAGGGVVAGGIAVAAVAIVWCANNQPKRNMRRDTWVDGRHDVYPKHNPRAQGCVVRGKAKPISARW